MLGWQARSSLQALARRAHEGVFGCYHTARWTHAMPFATPLWLSHTLDQDWLPEGMMAQLYGKAWTRAELTRYVADMGQLAGIRPVTYQDGPEAGVRALEFRTGRRARASPCWPSAPWTSAWPRSTACRSRS